MRYDEAVRELYALAPRGVELGLGRMKQALELFGHPELATRFVHIAGTNGKGSVSAIVERVLRESGKKTGLYTSPHLHRVVERIRIDGRVMSDASLVRGAKALRASELPPITFFEAMTLLSLLEFEQRGVDFAVLEVGLGGRLDATNVVKPEVAVVTNIGLEHTAWLGTTHAAIAAEKAAISKAGAPLVHGVDNDEARAVVEARGREVGAEIIDARREVKLELHDGLVDATYRGTMLRDVPLRLAGAHQIENLRVALATLFVLRERGHAIDDDSIRRGAGLVRWPGRVETLRRSPEILVDGAHNPDGCEVLAKHLRTLPQKRTVLVFGAMADKDLESMLASFDGLADERVFVAPELTRAASKEALAALRPGKPASSVEAGVAMARELATDRGRVVVAGSLFVVAAARAAVLGLRVDPAIAM